MTQVVSTRFHKTVFSFFVLFSRNRQYQAQEDMQREISSYKDRLSQELESQKTRIEKDLRDQFHEDINKLREELLTARIEEEKEIRGGILQRKQQQQIYQMASSQIPPPNQMAFSQMAPNPMAFNQMAAPNQAGQMYDMASNQMVHNQMPSIQMTSGQMPPNQMACNQMTPGGGGAGSRSESAADLATAEKLKETFQTDLQAQMDQIRENLKADFTKEIQDLESDIRSLRGHFNNNNGLTNPNELNNNTVVSREASPRVDQNRPEEQPSIAASTSEEEEQLEEIHLPAHNLTNKQRTPIPRKRTKVPKGERKNDDTQLISSYQK